MKGTHGIGMRVYRGRLPGLMRRPRFCAVQFTFLICSFMFYSPAWAQLDCVKQLDQAEDQYYQGHFDEAIQMAEDCLTQHALPEKQEIRAHTIIAKASVSKRHLDRAKDELRKILDIDPKVTLDPDVEPPQMIRLFEEIRKEKEKEVIAPRPPLPTEQPTTPPRTKRPPETKVKERDREKGWFARNWYIVAGGAVAVGVGVAMLGGGGSTPPPTVPVVLPEPPQFP